jgi:hypothetical protein
MAIPRRGLRDIRTHSGRVDETTLPSRAYLKISCLEMEKVRRGKERSSARQRMAGIDARLKEIEAEKAALLQALEGPPNGGRPRGVPGLELKLAARPSTGGFKLRY